MTTDILITAILNVSKQLSENKSPFPLYNRDITIILNAIVIEAYKEELEENKRRNVLTEELLTKHGRNNPPAT